MKLAPILRPTSWARSGFSSARPTHFTSGWRAATSPRNRPTRPPPMMARPMGRDATVMLEFLPVSVRRGVGALRHRAPAAGFLLDEGAQLFRRRAADGFDAALEQFFLHVLA